MPQTGIIYNFTRGNKFFELSNHLGNVLVTVTDKKTAVLNTNGTAISYYTGDVVSANDYAPFGLILQGRSINGSSYTYGFNGKRKDNELYGEGNTLDFGARIYDVRLGRFYSRDRLESTRLFNSPYLFAGDNPIAAIDYNGDVEVIVNVTIMGADGKTIIRTYTNTLIIETVDDLRGIHRDPIIVNVYQKMQKKEFRNGNTIAYYEVPVSYSAQIQAGSGLSNEDKKWAGSWGKLNKIIYKGLVKFFPPAKLADALAEGDRDPVTDEYRDPSKKYFQSAEAILDGISLGKGALAKKALRNVTMSQFKKLIDWGAEEVIKAGTEKLGLSSDKSNILSYYFIKYAYEAKSGEIDKMFKVIHTLIKLGTKGTDAINELNKEGIDLNMPINNESAAQDALTNTGITDIKVKQE